MLRKKAGREKADQYSINITQYGCQQWGQMRSIWLRMEMRIDCLRLGLCINASSQLVGHHVGCASYYCLSCLSVDTLWSLTAGRTC